MKLCLAVSYDVCVSRLAGEAEQALELLVCVLSHSASTQEAKDRAGQPRAEPEARLAPEQIAVDQGWAQTKAFDALVAEKTITL